MSAFIILADVYIHQSIDPWRRLVHGKGLTMHSQDYEPLPHPPFLSILQLIPTLEEFLNVCVILTGAHSRKGGGLSSMSLQSSETHEISVNNLKEINLSFYLCKAQLTGYCIVTKELFLILPYRQTERQRLLLVETSTSQMCDRSGVYLIVSRPPFILDPKPG